MSVNTRHRRLRGSWSEKIGSCFRVFAAPDHVVDHIVMHIDEYPEDEQEDERSEGFVVVADLPVQEFRYKPESQITQDNPGDAETGQAPFRRHRGLVHRCCTVDLETPDDHEILERMECGDEDQDNRIQPPENPYVNVHFTPSAET